MREDDPAGPSINQPLSYVLSSLGMALERAGKRAEAEALLRRALSLREAALRKLAEGETAFEEVARVAADTE